MQISPDVIIGALVVAAPTAIGWWVKSSLDKLDQIKLMDHKISVLSKQMTEIKGELRMIIEIGKSMAVLESKANTMFKKYDELNERLNKLNARIQ